MRILITTDTIGGVWTYARELSRGFLENGCAVALVSFGRIPNPAQLDWVAAQAARWGSRFRFAGSDAPLEWMQNNAHARSEAEPLLLRTAREFRADLLLSSQFCFGSLQCRIPRVVVAHSDVLSWAQACRREPLAETLWLTRYRSLVTNGLRHADAVIAPTECMLNALAANFQLPQRARVIANGRSVAPEAVYRSRKLQAVTAGRMWDEGKNLKLLAQVDSPVPLLVAGELEHEASLAAPACGNAVMLGALDEAELFALFRESSMYVCTSQYEPFGLAPLEAALCGCAVLANDIPSLREVWGNAALFFRDAEALSALLKMLAGNRRLLDRARARSRHRAQQLTVQRMTQNYLEFLKGILRPSMAGQYVA